LTAKLKEVDDGNDDDDERILDILHSKLVQQLVPDMDDAAAADD